MSEHGHDLHATFPDDHAILLALKADDPEFRALAERHHQLTEQIFDLDAGLEAGADTRIEDLKKARLALLDEVAAMIALRKASSN